MDESQLSTTGSARSADIIAFPRSAAASAVEPVGAAGERLDLTATQFPASTPTIDPTERLRLAIASLEAALAEQRVAVQTWRGAVADLQHSVGSLNTSMATYQDRLSALQAKSYS